MKLRAAVAVITSLIDEAAIVFVILWALPRFGIHLPVYFTAAIVIVFAGFCVLTYVYGTKILKKKPLIGLTDMIGMKGYAETNLIPDGMVKIKGEIWEAVAEIDGILQGTDIIVTGQNGLKLIVRRDGND